MFICISIFVFTYHFVMFPLQKYDNMSTYTIDLYRFAIIFLQALTLNITKSLLSFNLKAN